MGYTRRNLRFVILPMPNIPHYQCPICDTQLNKIERSLVCENNHQFDFAKEGYVNLLPVQFKKSLHPGDDKAMVIARRNFLELGHYEFLRQKLLELIQSYAPATLVDLGCGEGYYTSYVQQSVSEADVYGVDISKDAVRYSAKRNKDVHYCVATNAKTPFSNAYFDLILNVFAPLVGKECQRILSEHGVIISAAPGKQHLIELKQAIYDNVELHDAATVPDGFERVASHNITETIMLTTQPQMNDLLTMTPFGWKITVEKKQQLFARAEFPITLSFDINIFKPISL